MKTLVLSLLLSGALVNGGSHSQFFPMRRGRATSVPVTAPEEPLVEASLGGTPTNKKKEELFSSLLEAILPQENVEFPEVAGTRNQLPESAEYFEETEDSSPILNIPVNSLALKDSDTWKEYNNKYSFERPLPRSVEAGAQLRQFTDVSEPAMNLLGSVDETLLRQSDDGAEATDGAAGEEGEDEIRCIPKVMQVEETVYDRALKCTHSYHEKCHMTFITDYLSTTEEKCETSFVKECHITFKPMAFEEKVNVCHTPLVRQCGSEPVGPEICSTHYETSCETKYTSYEVEQDTPVCKMEMIQKCENITLPVPPTRQFDSDGGDDSSTTGEGEASSDDGTGSSITLEQRCEDWPVQKCTLEKQLVSKVKPETACRKIPRQVCIPNNCEMVPSEELCKDDTRTLVQNVPQEECELQPEENCFQESVLVPKLIQKPNCVKVPKEVCVNTKKNPRRVKKPVVKEWCYNPKDLLENRGSFPLDILAAGQGQAEANLFS